MSQVKVPLSPVELVALLIRARTYNELHHITGSLVYGEGQFMQVLEGDEATITALYERIARDTRHQTIFKLADKAIAERTFTRWSMAFCQLSPEQFQDLEGFVSPAQWAQNSLAPDTADALLLTRMREMVLTSGGRW